MPITNEVRFLDMLKQLTCLLSYRGEDDKSLTIFTLLKEIKTAAWMIRGGHHRGGCEDFAMRRLDWRVKYDLVDRSTYNDAMKLLQAVIRLGIELMRPIDWRVANSFALISTIRVQTGVDLAA